MEEEKHNISLYVELVLYKTIKDLIADKNLSRRVKEKKKKEAIEICVQKCMNISKTMSKKQIKEHVIFVLNRTIANLEQEER